MARHLLIWLLLSFVYKYSIAQVSDDFSDGDFTQSPLWSGDQSKFEVEGLQRLHLNAPAVSDQAYLSTPSQAIANAVWNFYVEISVNPSASNFTKIYLTSNQGNLSGSLEGYFVKIGGSDDEISLFRQDGISETKIIDGVDDRVNSSLVQLFVEVSRDLDGQWTLSSRLLSESGYFEEGTVSDDTHTVSSHMGVYCQYTSTRSSAFYFDDITVVGTPIPDLSPPDLLVVKVNTPEQIVLVFSEELELSNAEDPLNYRLENNTINNAQYIANTVFLSLNSPLVNGLSRSLDVSGLTDTSGNLMPQLSVDVLYYEEYTPNWQSIQINEFLADPTPAKLNFPDDSQAEYIELYNADTIPYNLNDWVINGSQLPSKILLPGEYLILCSTAFSAEYANYGDIITLTSWPTLTNSGATLKLVSDKGVIVDSLVYGASDVAGGIATERIYPLPPCSITYNYGLSTDANGGTPGRINSIFSNTKDTSPPELLEIIALYYDSLQLYFSEKIYTTNSWVHDIRVDDEAPILSTTYQSDDSTVLLLTFDKNLPPGKRQITITNLRDCEGNIVSTLTKSFTLDLTPPKPIQVIPIDSSSLELIFEEKVIPLSAEKEKHYILLPADIHPKKTLLSDDSTTVQLDFQNRFVLDNQYYIQLSEISDSNDNIISSTTPSEIFFTFTNDIDTVVVVNDYQVKAIFSKQISVEKMDTTSIYINRSVGSPQEVVVNSEKNNELNLMLNSPLVGDREHELSIKNLYSEDGAIMATPIYRFKHDKRGPKIINVFATTDTLITIELNETILIDDTSLFQLYINNDTAAVDSLWIDGNKLNIYLEESLKQESNIEIAVAGVFDRYNNTSSLDDTFVYYFDQSPPRLDTAYFVSHNTVIVEFHEEIRPVDGQVAPIASSVIAIHQIDFLKLHPNMLRIRFDQEDLHMVEFNISNLADNNNNIVSEPITIQALKIPPFLGKYYAASDTELYLQFTQEVEPSVVNHLNFEDDLQLDSITVLSGYQLLVHTRNPLIESRSYTFQLGGKSYQFVYQTKVSSVEFYPPSTLKINWVTNLSEDYATSVECYQVNERHTPIAVTYNQQEQFTQLLFTHKFENDRVHTIRIQDLYDSDGYRIVDSDHLFGYGQTPDRHQLIITEVMADPIPALSLPEVEYIELYNRSDKPINLKGLKLSDINQSCTLPDAWLLPKEYAALCHESTENQLLNFGKVIGVNSFPNLSAESDTILLSDEFGRTIHTVAYDPTFYNDSHKSKGGWSLEMIDVNFPCLESRNWVASSSDAGGTPGRVNAVVADNPDNSPPILINAIALDSLTILIRFDERLHSSVLHSLSLSIKTNIIKSVTLLKDEKSLEIKVKYKLVEGQIDHITASKAKDCSGNVLLENQVADFVLPEMHNPDDIMLSEILYNPRSGGVDFIELYNQSDRYISLLGWQLAVVKADGIEYYQFTNKELIIPPVSYLALSSNIKTLRADYPSATAGNLYEAASFPNLNADGNTLALVDNSGNEMQRVSYNDGWHHPLLKQTKGVSLERISWAKEINKADSWESASFTSGFATPGLPNSQLYAIVSASEALTTHPKVIFPDQSGYQDYTQISLSAQSPGAVLNLKIYNSAGKLVRSLAQNKTIGEENIFIWDGTDDGRARANNGYYLIWAEVFDPSGTLKVFKTKVVVGSTY